MLNDCDISTEKYFLYFAYGSCMNQQSLSASLGHDVKKYFIGPAILPDYRLLFNYASLSEPVCCANIEPFVGGRVEGALYRLPVDCATSIDQREGVPSGRYNRLKVRVLLKDSSIRYAITYRGRVTVTDEAAPSDRYRLLLIQGLIDTGVSQHYHTEIIRKISLLPNRF